MNFLFEIHKLAFVTWRLWVGLRLRMRKRRFTSTAPCGLSPEFVLHAQGQVGHCASRISEAALDVTSNETLAQSHTLNRLAHRPT
jgi:hypothetical protein